MKNTVIASSKDLIMVLLYAKGPNKIIAEPIPGRTRLMKMIYLFKKEVWKQFELDKVIDQSALPDFRAYDYGPFSDNVYADLEFLRDIDFIRVKALSDDEASEEEAESYRYWQINANVDPDPTSSYNDEEFSLTDLGREFVEETFRDKLTKQRWEILDEFKRRCTETSLKALLKYVYTKYPEDAEKSKIKKAVLTNS